MKFIEVDIRNKTTTNTINATGDYNRIAQAGRDATMGDTIHGNQIQRDQIQGDQIQGNQMHGDVYNQYRLIWQPLQQNTSTGKNKYNLYLKD